MKEYLEKDLIMDALLHERYGYCCEDAINAIPAADVVEVRHGYWEDTNKSVRCHEAYRFNWWCSECGEPQHTPVAKTLGEFTKENPFCHCCGAKMDGGADDAAD